MISSLRIFLKYCYQLVTTWVSVLFFIIDGLGFLSMYFEFILPITPTPPILIAIAVIGLISANFYIYLNKESEVESLQKIIQSLQDREANITLKVVNQEFSLPSSLKPTFSINTDINQFGFNSKGVPLWVMLWASIEATNTGEEQGKFQWKIDTTQSQLPVPFCFAEQKPGSLALWNVAGRKKDSGDFYLFLKINENYTNPDSFAQAMSSLNTYNIILTYSTEKLTGVSEQQNLSLSGGFENFLEKLFQYWNNNNLNSLVVLAQNHTKPVSKKSFFRNLFNKFLNLKQKKHV